MVRIPGLLPHGGTLTRYTLLTLEYRHALRKHNIHLGTLRRQG